MRYLMAAASLLRVALNVVLAGPPVAHNARHGLGSWESIVDIQT